ncbi:hypothetical protein VP01_8507g1, partial [Puccinia sorghi]
SFNPFHRCFLLHIDNLCFTEFSEFLVLLDEIAQSQRRSAFYKPSGPPPRVRDQDENHPVGRVQPKSCLPHNVYSPDWLQEQTPNCCRSLEIKPPCDIEHVIQVISGNSTN